MSRPHLKRDQHPKFGTEIRALLATKTSEAKELAGIIISEVDSLVKHRNEGRRHPKEESFTNNDVLRDIGYLKLRNSGNSIRVYFMLAGGSIWILGIDPNKRRTNVTDAMRQTLRQRVSDINSLVAKGHETHDQG